MTEQGIFLERKGRVVVVTLRRPQRQNAFNEAMFLELGRVTRELKKNLPRVVVLTGADKVFCAGFDVNPDNPWVAELIAAVEKSEKAPAERLIRGLRTVVDAFVSLPVPIIAAINGLAYGGGAELAVRCALNVIRQSRNRSLHQSLDLEAEQAVSLIVSGECFHGVAAFLEKREPDFPDNDCGFMEE